MPKYELSVPLNNSNKETALALAYQAMQKLEWIILFAGENSIVANTVKSWNAYPLQLTCTVDDHQLIINSKMINNEAFDAMGKNKKNCNKFVDAFEEERNHADATAIERTKETIIELRHTTIKKAEEEAKEAAAVSKAMNLEGSNLYLTYSIIGINVLMFILMLMNGAGIIEPDAIVHIKWGSNYSPLTLSGDWWRLVTNVFIHFGIIHLLMNMYCLYTIGIYLEPMLGKARFITGYLCTGILASLTSLWWHKEGINSAGASGAIFGMYGIFLALLTTNLIPQSVRKSLLQSIGIFIAYNLFYGMKSGVDNAAHIGGLLSGFVIGYIYAFDIKKQREDIKLKWVLPVIILVSIGIAVMYLQQNIGSVKERKEALDLVKNSSYKDAEKFNDILLEFDKTNKQLYDFLSDTTATDETLLKNINEVGFPACNKTEDMISRTSSYDVSPASHTKANKLFEYMSLRKNELELIKEMIETKKNEEIIPKINEVREKQSIIFQELLKDGN